MLVVTLNYRLWSLGFMALDALQAEATAIGGGSTGNHGVQDQRLALQWVQQNIRRWLLPGCILRNQCEEEWLKNCGNLLFWSFGIPVTGHLDTRRCKQVVWKVLHNPMLNTLSMLRRQRPVGRPLCLWFMGINGQPVTSDAR